MWQDKQLLSLTITQSKHKNAGFSMFQINELYWYRWKAKGPELPQLLVAALVYQWAIIDKSNMYRYDGGAHIVLEWLGNLKSRLDLLNKNYDINNPIQKIEHV